MTIEASIDETPRCLTEGRTVLGECPTWDAAERALYWLDVMEGDIFRIEPASGALRRWSIKRKPHALALRQGGGMILTVRNGFWSFDQATGALEELRDAAPELPRNFVNDAKCDA
ncbi:MAG: SMP-30/gluconolactonase/LRE family protein, partial [Alphaproteobacteria bacterium]|nr:SMP-30/gluconolactonase/LRE family protein [Alphaproteobacteria bacterium]